MRRRRLSSPGSSLGHAGRSRAILGSLLERQIQCVNSCNAKYRSVKIAPARCVSTRVSPEKIPTEPLITSGENHGDRAIVRPRDCGIQFCEVSRRRAASYGANLPRHKLPERSRESLRHLFEEARLLGTRSIFFSIRRFIIKETDTQRVHEGSNAHGRAR